MPNKLNVVVFSHGGGSPKHGPNMRWHYLGEAMRDQGVEVTVVASSYFHKWFNFPKVKGVYKKASVGSVNYIWLRTNGYRSKIFQVLNQFVYSLSAFFLTPFLFKGAVDVVVASSPHPLMIYAARRFAKKKGASLIYEVRDLWPLVIQNLSGASDSHPYIRLIAGAERYAIKHADAVVSVKPGDSEYFLKKYYIDQDHFYYMPNGFLPSEIDKFDGGQIESSIFTIGYIGALSSYYQIDILIESARILQNNSSVEYRIIGGGEDEERLRALVGFYGLKNVTFAGKVSKEQVAKEISKLNACYVGLKNVEANLYGISCNKIFEYMYAAKPIIASYVTNYDPVATARCGITVPSGDANAISQAILELKSNPIMAAELGRNGLEYFNNNHNFSVIAMDYVTLFQKLKMGSNDD